MNKQELRNKILKVIKGPKLGALATITGGKPWVRLVMCHSDRLNLYICTFKDSRKVQQIKNNPNVHITISKDLNDIKAPYVQVAARASVRSDAKIRYKYWHEFMKKYYSGPDDPSYVVIEIKPRFIEYLSTEVHKAQVYKI